MARLVTVTLTRPQVHALLAAVSYCTSGEPGDWGQDEDASGDRIQATLDRAGDVLASAARVQA